MFSIIVLIFLESGLLFSEKDPDFSQFTQVFVDEDKNDPAELIEKGDYLGAIRMLRQRIEAEVNIGKVSESLQTLANYFSFTGDYSKALLTMARSRAISHWPALPPSFERESLVRLYAELRWEDPKKLIRKAASRYRMIIFGEASYIAEHRAYGIQLLPVLYEAGFRYAAVECLSSSYENKERVGIERNKLNGDCVFDPQMANFLRQARRLGYKLVVYSDVRTQGEREELRAQNIYERIFKKDPYAKVVIWTANKHIFKRAGASLGDSDKKQLAYWLWQKTGFEPFCVYQESDELDFLLTSSNRYWTFVVNNPVRIKRPLALINQAGKTPATSNLFSVLMDKTSDGKPAVDAYLFHPPSLDISPTSLRPSWMNYEGIFTVLGAVTTVERKLPKRVQEMLVQAFIENEGLGSTPVDQMACDKDGIFELKLFPGTYTIQVVGPGGRIVAEQAHYDVKVSKKSIPLSLILAPE